MVNGTNGTNGTIGSYFTVGKYIAIRDNSEVWWRVSKITINPNLYSSFTLDYVISCPTDTIARKYMEDLDKTDTSTK